MDSFYRQLGYIALILTVLLTSGFWAFIFSIFHFCIFFYFRFLVTHVVLLLVLPEFKKTLYRDGGQSKGGTGRVEEQQLVS
jgi:hypothetical protein